MTRQNMIMMIIISKNIKKVRGWLKEKLNKLNDFVNKWIIISLLLAVLTIWIPILFYQIEQRKIKNNEIIFLNEVNVENLRSLKFILNSLETETKLQKFVNAEDGKISEYKRIQFWDHFMTNIYSNNLYMITKNYNYDKSMVIVYNGLIDYFEKFNYINSYLNNLFPELNKYGDINKDIINTNIAKLQVLLRENAISSFNVLVPVVVNSYHQHKDVLNNEGIKEIEQICNNKDNFLWVQEFKKNLRDCSIIYNGPIDYEVIYKY